MKNLFSGFFLTKSTYFYFLIIFSYKELFLFTFVTQYFICTFVKFYPLLFMLGADTKTVAVSTTLQYTKLTALKVFAFVHDYC